MAGRSWVTVLLCFASLSATMEASAAKLTATWNETSTDVDGFSIERAVATDPTFAVIATLPGGSTSFLDADVTAGNTYCYRLRAFNIAGYSDYSEVACAAAVERYALVVVRTDTGTGTVISTPDGISCGTNCSAIYPSGTSVTLSATADSGSDFSGWQGADATAPVHAPSP